VLSPLLSNLYLHDVLDEWLVRDVPAHLKGGWFITRFADDYVLGFERREDAVRVLNVLPKRFARYGLSLHPEKTRRNRLAPALRKAQIWRAVRTRARAWEVPAGLCAVGG
jgi:hypothetical protein